jgi:hypothetical protein
VCEKNLASDCEPVQLLWLISWLPVARSIDAFNRMAETRLQRVLPRVIHRRSTRLGARAPSGRQVMDRPVPQVGSRSGRSVREMGVSPLVKHHNRQLSYTKRGEKFMTRQDIVASDRNMPDSADEPRDTDFL